MDLHVHGGNVESLEHDLRHALTVGRIHCSFHTRSTLLEGAEGRQGESLQSSPKYFRSGGATTSNAVDGANAVNALVMRSPIPCNVVEQRNAGVQVIADVNVALHDAQGRPVVEPAGNEGITRVKRQASGRGPATFIPPQAGGCHLVHRPLQRLCLPLVAGIPANSSSCKSSCVQPVSTSCLNLMRCRAFSSKAAEPGAESGAGALLLLLPDVPGNKVSSRLLNCALFGSTIRSETGS